MGAACVCEGEVAEKPQGSKTPVNKPITEDDPKTLKKKGPLANRKEALQPAKEEEKETKKDQMSDLDRYIDEAIDKLSPEAIDKFLTKMCKKNEKRANKKAEPEAEPEAAENSQSSHAVTINHAEHVEEVEGNERCLNE